MVFNLYLISEVLMRSKCIRAVAAAALVLVAGAALGSDHSHPNHDNDNHRGHSCFEENYADEASAALPFPDVADTSDATCRVASVFRGFFSAKSLHHAAPMVGFFAPAPDAIFYADAGLGLVWPSQAALLTIWQEPAFANGPPNALSYPLRVIGDIHSAVLEFVDTPELLGNEYRFLSSVTFDDDGKIIRWVDYWDGRSSQVQLPIGTLGPYPTDFHDGVVDASPEIKEVSDTLQNALSLGDASAAGRLFTADAVYEDMALHTRLEGKLQISRYLARSLKYVPYGLGATVAHVSGSARGGGYEWNAAPSASPLKRGITALEIDQHGKIRRLTTIYDAYQFSDAKYEFLNALGAEK